ncbi:hypothetical protein EC968_002014 [Mortierella alpina]|nr:hypothetical protein EC968_002014 [Mortierella alpina]
MVQSTVFAFAATLLTLLASSVVDAAPLMQRAASGQTGALISASQYCLFLPPQAGGDIAKSEDDAVAFCNTAIDSAPGARTLPDGLITKVNFIENKEKGYVQITGTLNPSAYNLASSDEGGQYGVERWLLIVIRSRRIVGKGGQVVGFMYLYHARYLNLATIN